MTSANQFLSKDDRRRIDDSAADTADVATRHGAVQFKPAGTNSIKGDCPACSAKAGLEIVKSGTKLGVFKCFHCGEGGKGGAAYLQKMHGMDWKAAYTWLASQYHIALSEPADAIPEKKTTATADQTSFRDLQLAHSGIPLDTQKIKIKSSEQGHSVEIYRYEPGTMTPAGDTTRSGPDMLLHYVDLRGQLITYTPRSGAKPKPVVRVRYRNPALHTDRDGREIKYRSPLGSGSHLWIPNHIITAYTLGTETPVLYIVEGEKKADKMCLHGLPAVGIQGIHNLANEAMPRTFESIIERCRVQHVVFVVDSDYQNISATRGKPVDARPRTFLRAIQRFGEYFQAYQNQGIALRMHMVAGRSARHKGIDDLLCHLQSEGHETLQQPGLLAADIAKALIDREGKGEHVDAYNIHPQRISQQKLLEIFHLDDAEKFFATHLNQLREIGDFKFKNLQYFYNTESGKVELAQQILPQEQFYDLELFSSSKKDFIKVTFNYDRIRRFLFNRGVGLYEYQPGLYRTVRREGNILQDVSHTWIQRYVVDFAETLPKEWPESLSFVGGSQRDAVINMLLKGNTQYLGPNNLNYMYTHEPQWVQPSPHEQILVFRNCYWRITATSIEQRPIGELNGAVWQSQVIDFEPTLQAQPMLRVERQEGKWRIRETEAALRCEMFEYVKCTSLFAWKKHYELLRDPVDKALRYVPREEPEALTPQELDSWHMHMATKLIAWGYKLRTWRDRANMRAVICMDGLESQVGKSQGGSGKSLFATATEYCQGSSTHTENKSVFVVDGKTADIKNDRFMYHGVDERTREIVFDDVRVNFPFEDLFSQITSAIRVKPFQGAPITIPAPVFTITTNHALNGEGNSFKRRQYLLGFSNFFNEYRTPAQHFGHLLFSDWDQAQWNAYYNLMAVSVQVYMQYPDLGRYCVESDDIDRRRQRQQIGEDFLDFAETYFAPGYMLNRLIVKERVLDDYLDIYPSARRYMDARKIKTLSRLYASYRGYTYNPGADGPDDRIKSSGHEFILIADAEYDRNAPGEKIFKTTVVTPGEIPF